MKRTLSGNSQIRWGAVLSYVGIVLNIGAALFYTPWIKNQIGMSDYGLYTLAISFISLFMMDFGLGAATARFAAKYRAEGNTAAVNDLLGLVYKLYLLIDVVACAALVVLFFCLEFLYAGLTAAELSRFKELYVIVSAFSLCTFPFSTLNGVLGAYERFVPLKLCDVCQKVLSVAAVVCVLLCGFGLRALVLAQALVGTCVVLLKWGLVKKITPVKANWQSRDKALFRTVAGFAVWSCVAGIATRLMHTVTPSVLAAVSTSYHVAVFAPAMSISEYFYTIAAAVNGLFLPTVSRKLAEHKEQEILPLMIRVGRYQMMVLGLLYVGLCVVGRDFICLWMGREFAPAYACALLLTFPHMIEYSQQIAHTAMVAQNKVKYTSLAWLIGSLVNVVLAVILAARYGVIGVGVAGLVGSLVAVTLCNLLYQRCLHIPMRRFYRACYWPMLIPIGGGVALSAWLTAWLHVGGWWGLLIKGGITVAVFLLLVFVLYLRKDEKMRLFAALGF